MQAWKLYNFQFNESDHNIWQQIFIICCLQNKKKIEYWMWAARTRLVLNIWVYLIYLTKLFSVNSRTFTISTEKINFSGQKTTNVAACMSLKNYFNLLFSLQKHSFAFVTVVKLNQLVKIKSNLTWTAFSRSKLCREKQRSFDYLREHI